jgi:uncharacterized iron-regulated membrane protein
MGAVFVVIVVLAACCIGLAMALTWLSAQYDELTGRPPAARGAGTLAALGAAVDGGAEILRVHDVAETRQAVDAWLALTNPDYRAQAGLDPMFAPLS